MKVPNHDKEYDFGFILEFAYKVDGSDEEIVVATTRPETMLGDTAVAVHPEDPRWKHLHGKSLVHPFLNRKIPVVTDSELVLMEFGTGAVKVTPAHDHNDYLCGKRHNLQIINIINDNGTLNDNAGPYKGMKRFDAREAVIEALKEKKLYRGIKDNPMTIAICSRSKDIIEPMLKPQWWVNCKEMAEKAITAVKKEELEIIPPNHKDTWFRWLENIHDWCISRQLWWGHRCPAYLVEIEGQPKPEGSKNDNWVVGRNQEEALQNAIKKHPSVDPSKIKLHQDPDVLDTWFSSGLFPFSVFGWPDNTDDMKAFYPTALLETGHDILFFWVARMVMMGIELTGKLPFTQVFLHAMVRDAHGRKMSKSLGNVIDPVWMIEGMSLEKLNQTLLEGNLDAKEVEKAKEGQKSDYPNGIPECGTDATRFALCAYTSQGRDINLDINRVSAYRNFCNKLWNATKFALMNLGTEFKPADKQPVTGESIWEQWILSRLNAAIRLTNEGFKKYDFAQATTAIYNFWLYEFCDVFLESTKPTMQADSSDPAVAKRQNSARETLLTCLDNGLRLISPFMPFVSEELYQRIPHRASLNFESICIADYPQEVNGWTSEQVERDIKFSQDVIKGIRSLRASFGLTKEKPVVTVSVKTKDLFDILSKSKDVVSFLTHSSDLVPAHNLTQQPEGCAVEIVSENCQIFMLIKGLVDISTEIDKLDKKKAKIQSDHDKLVKQTQGPHYQKVPQSLRDENQKKLEGYLEEIDIATKSIENYKKFL